MGSASVGPIFLGGLMNVSKFLKSNQEPFTVPPGFRQFTATSKSGQKYDISLNRNLKNWSKVDVHGNILRNAEIHEILEEHRKYKQLTASMYKRVNNGLLVTTKDNVFLVRYYDKYTPNILSRLKVSVMGENVIIFNDVDYRDTNTHNITTAEQLLSSEHLTDHSMVNGLYDEQKLSLKLLISEEMMRRIPEPERQIKDVFSREKNAELIKVNETKNGYSITFNYKGMHRTIHIKEDLMLTSAGMCLVDHYNGNRDYAKEYSLETYFSVLDMYKRRY